MKNQPVGVPYGETTRMVLKEILPPLGACAVVRVWFPLGLNKLRALRGWGETPKLRCDCIPFW